MKPKKAVAVQCAGLLICQLQGDSGGGLVMQHPTQNVLVGVLIGRSKFG